MQSYPCFRDNKMDPLFYSKSIILPFEIRHCNCMPQRLRKSGLLECENRVLKEGKRKNKCLNIHIGDMHYHFTPVSGSRHLRISRLGNVILGTVFLTDIFDFLDLLLKIFLIFCSNLN